MPLIDLLGLFTPSLALPVKWRRFETPVNPIPSVTVLKTSSIWPWFCLGHIIPI